MLCHSLFSNLRLSRAVATDQSKTTIRRAMTPLGVYKSTLSYVCFIRDHWPQSAWARKHPSIFTCTLPFQISQEVQQRLPFVLEWFSHTLIFWTLLHSLPYSNTTHSCLQLSAMSIIMKTTHKGSFFLKVSKQELSIDGVSKGMYLVLRRRKTFSYSCITKHVLSFVSKQVMQKFLSKDGVSDTLNYSKCNNTA